MLSNYNSILSLNCFDIFLFVMVIWASEFLWVGVDFEVTGREWRVGCKSW